MKVINLYFKEIINKSTLKVTSEDTITMRHTLFFDKHHHSVSYIVLPMQSLKNQYICKIISITIIFRSQWYDFLKNMCWMISFEIASHNFTFIKNFNRVFPSLSIKICNLSCLIENLSKLKAFIPSNQHFIFNHQINVSIKHLYNPNRDWKIRLFPPKIKT